MRNINFNEIKNISLFSAFLMLKGENMVNIEVNENKVEMMRLEIWLFISNYNKA